MATLSEKYIDEIASGLTEHHAAVLVGAGFSRNADPANDSVRGMMPLWGELTDIFCDKLGMTEAERRYTSTLDVAQQVSATFGRPCLDSMIRDAMNDENYVPSDIHRTLVSLHWTDIFTTNYDTLLERASSYVTDRKYRIVRTQDDLIYSAGAPRIIKLHGSFPSNGPFIITQEDFRKYPQDHASLVNTVRQSMIENIFCLIGFSGDDPNFLKWIGWIHDTLGIDNSPVIYLISHTQISSAKGADLISKNIRIINLQEVPGYIDQSLTQGSDEYTREIYRRFLNDLKNKSDNILSGHAYKSIKHWPGTKWDKLYNCSCSSINDIHDYLTKIHENYPGWIFAPFDTHSSVSRLITGVEQTYLNRMRLSKGQRVSVAQEESLLRQAQNDDENIAAEQKTGLCLDIVYEYVWLHNIIGRPLPIQCISDIKPFVDDYKKNTDAAHIRTSERDRKLHFIYLGLMRSYRIHGYNSEWDELFTEVSGFQLNVDERNALVYEDIYHDIDNLRFQNISDKTDKIITDGQNIWVLRKASILALTGRYTEALNILWKAINSLGHDSNDQSEKNIVRKQSVRNCLIELYNFVVQARDISSGIFKDYDEDEVLIDDSKDRFLSDFIWERDNIRYADFLNDNYYLKSSTSISPAFDIGSSTTSVTFGGSDKDILIAMEFLGFRESTGIPFRISNVVNKRGAMGSAKRIAPYSALYPIVLSVLTQDDKIISQIWSRNYMSDLTAEDADSLVDLCNSALNTSLDNINSSTNLFFNKKLVEFPLTIMPEILSRLCSKCSSDKFYQILQTIVRLYSFHGNRSMPDTRALTRRFIRCVPLKLLLENMDVFWQLPLISDPYELSYFSEPFRNIYYRIKNIRYVCEITDKMELTEKETGLIQLLFSECANANHNAIVTRLTYLSQIYDFTENIQKKFEDILFAPDNMTGDVPYLGDFYASSLSLFSQRKLSSDGKAQGWDNIIKRLEDSSVPGTYTDYSPVINVALSFMQQNHLIIEQVKCLSDTLLKFCNKFVDYIRNDSEYLGVVEPYAKSNLQSVGNLMGEALLSAGLAGGINFDGYRECVQIKQLLESADIPCSLLGYCLDQDDNKEDHFVDNALSGDDRHVSEGMEAIYTLDRYCIHIRGRLSDILIDALYTGTSYSAYVKAVEFYIRKGIFSDKEICRVDRSLPKYLSLTAFSDSDSEQEISDKIFLRNCIANLAHTMDLHKGKNDLPGVAEWKTANAAPEEFAEIRNSWDEL